MLLLLAGIGLIVGLLLAPIVVRVVGQTTSFLRFDNTDAPLEIIFTPTVLLTGGLTALLAASSGLYLAWRTTRQTITIFKQQLRRASKPWWQRAYLDVLLLIPAYYALYTLSQQGGLVTSAEDPFGDPLTFLGPTLFALGNTLLFIRLWPYLLRFAAKIVAYGNSIALLLALRELTRSISRYRGGLLMMCFTLSLTAFTASMASTIDRSLVDSVNYRLGADVVLVTVSQARIGVTGAAAPTLTGFNTQPASDLLTNPDIVQVSRVGRYDAQIFLPDQVLDGVVLGVDRSAMPAIASFRVDYADVPIANVFNKLAIAREGVLMSAVTSEKHHLQIGQEITFQLKVLGATYETKVPIVGVLNYFPTLDPTTKFFLIANIEPIWELVGTELPHDIWLSLKPGADTAKVAAAVRAKRFPVIQWQDSKAALHAAQTAPSRRGVLGFLSVGFAASILLTLVGVVVQSSASFREQAVQLGALRAMGLRRISVALYLIVSQGLAAAAGIGGGTFIGALSTMLFLPLLDFSGGLPPYLVRVAWNDIIAVYIVFAGALFGVILLTTFILGRQQLFTMVKLGEAS
jgi:putative ABC transport system permease protein